jgi:hypothetical protein
VIVTTPQRHCALLDAPLERKMFEGGRAHPQASMEYGGALNYDMWNLFGSMAARTWRQYDMDYLGVRWNGLYGTKRN